MTSPQRFSGLRRKLAVFLVTLLGLASLAACGSSSASTGSDAAGGASGAASTTSTDTGAWPRTIRHELGETVIAARPQKIVSTSLTLTGTLLAINAPLTGSGASKGGVPGFDTNGFFSQWAPVAAERNVKPLYKNLELDLEAVTAARPDLIVISTTGADSTKDSYAALSRIAPTIALNYSTQSWEELATELGPALGMEEQVKTTLAEFTSKIAAAKAKITKPEGQVQAIVFNGTGEDTAFALSTGPHNALLSELGLGVTNPEFPGNNQKDSARKDFAFVSTENAVVALTAPTVLLINGDEDTLARFKASAPYANAPALKSGKVVPLSQESFRIDYFSALKITDILTGAFGS